MSAPDLDKHDVLVSDFDVPCRVPRVPKWVLPRSFLEGPVDKIALDRHLSTSYQSCVDRVEELLTGNDIAAAIAHWSKCQEQAFDAASCHCDGARRHLSKKYFGRCQRTEPKMVQLAMPRCKTGRPGDYQPPHLIASTHVRQLVSVCGIFLPIGMDQFCETQLNCGTLSAVAQGLESYFQSGVLPGWAGSRSNFHHPYWLEKSTTMCGEYTDEAS